MIEKEWYIELIEKAKHDPYYQECLAEVKALEPMFLAVRFELPEMQQRALDAYISACEELDHALLMLANKE